MSPRQLASGALTLVRHGRVPHTEDCPFFRLRPAVDIAGDTRSLPAFGAGEISGGQLLAAIRVLLARAGFDRIKGSGLRMLGQSVVAADTGMHYGQIDLAGDVTIGGEPLREHWVTHVNGLRAALRTGSERPVFMGVVNEIGESLVRTQRDGTAFRFPVADVSMRAPIEGPFWVIGTLERDRQIVQPALAWPVLSGGILLPIESELHRDTARVLCRQLVYWRERHSLDLELQVPLIVGSGTPDFWLQVGEESIAVDVVPKPGYGRWREEVLLRAAVRGQGHGFVIDDWEPETWRRRLTGLVLGLAGGGDARKTQ
ncbi:hypothetical protein C7S18_23780 (plasmid) [Ahniella affigens]|uniref:Uncharacterized protein n=2 Tax=Ahniella affigens TaxID=2021234 RepID=A0A2P1PZP7_9GAMM|nr:hypothetical protein C7S18_23780 [Ahniella affigens]